MPKSHPELIKWECNDTILSNEFDAWKGTAKDFYNYNDEFLKDFFRNTTQPVNLRYTIGADVLHERETPGLMGDYRSPPWCIPACNSCYNRELLYEITQEATGLPIIIKKGKKWVLNEKLFGSKVYLEAWCSIDPYSFGTLRIKGKDGVFYLIEPQHTYGGPYREEVLSQYDYKHPDKKRPRMRGFYEGA